MSEQPPPNTCPLSGIQKAILRAYDVFGDYGAVKSLKDSAECGDSLLDFLLKEADESEGCDSKAVALERIRVAHGQLAAVIDALVNLSPGEEFQNDDGPGMA